MNITYYVYSLSRIGRVYHVGIAPGETPTVMKDDRIEFHHQYPFNNRTDAEQYKWQLAQHYGIHERVETLVLCEQTGETFPSANAAAKAHDLATSALINHLNGRIGHRTVKGRTYRRVPKGWKP